MTIYAIRRSFKKFAEDAPVSVLAPCPERFVVTSKVFRQSFFICMTAEGTVRLGDIGPGKGNQSCGEIGRQWFEKALCEAGSTGQGLFNVLLSIFYVVRDRNCMNQVDGQDMVLRFLVSGN